MQRPARQIDQFGSGGADQQPSGLLRRLREDPLDAINRIAGEIGARRATALGEAQAAAYLDGRLRRAGLRVSVDAFQAAIHAGWDGTLLALLAMMGVGLYYWLPLPSLALACCTLAIAIIALLRPGVPLLARKRPSQNVIATRALDAPPRWRVVLLAGLDSPPVSARFARMLSAGSRPLLGRVIACVVLALLALLALSGPLELRRLWWYGQFLVVAYLLLLAAIDIWQMFAPTTAGAANHAGALATLLESANTLRGLAQTELWAVGLGATSNGAGLADLMRRYPFDPAMTVFIGLESIGGGRMSYVTRAGVLPQRPGDPLLLRLISEAEASEPLIDAEPRPYYSEPPLIDALQRAGQHAMTIIGLDADGHPARRGQLADTVDQIDPQMVEGAVRLVVGLVKKIDTT